MLDRIVNMWAKYPTTIILIRKEDFKSAQAAIQSATQINWTGTLFLLISLRLTFGGANGPAKWSTTAKQITDLGNALLLDGT